MGRPTITKPKQSGLTKHGKLSSTSVPASSSSSANKRKVVQESSVNNKSHAKTALSSRSEIEDIFAGHGTGNIAELTAGPSTSLAEKKNEKKRKKKNRRLQDEEEEEEWLGFSVDAPSDLKPDPSIPTVKIILDPSVPNSFPVPKSSHIKKRKVEDAVSAERSKGVEKFKDSRGSGPRRRTEEGYAVYKEDELGIQHSGGDTPLCPFDCDCCF